MNTTCLTILVLLASVAIAAHAQGKVGLSEVTEKEARDWQQCLGVIVCEAHKPLELKRIHDKAGPRFQKNGLGWLAEVWDMPNVKEEDFWNLYPSYICKKDYSERRYGFKIFMGRAGNYYVEVCEKEPDTLECDKCDDSMSEFVAVMQEYRLNGVCNNPEKNADNVAESMKVA